MRDAKSYYCTMENELIGWKARAYDLMREKNDLEVINKKPIATFQRIHAVIDDLEKNIGLLSAESPSEGDGVKKAVDKNISELRKIWEDLSPSDER